MGVKSAQKIAMVGQIEATPGAGPGGAGTPVLVDPAALVTPSAETTERNVVQDTWSKLSPSQTQKTFTLSVSVEIVGGGTAVDAPAADWMYQAAGLVQKPGSIFTIDTVVSGPFRVGELIQNTTTPGTVGRCLFVVGTTMGIYELQTAPSPGDALSGDDSSASTTCQSTPEDSFVYQPTSERDELKTAYIEHNLDGISTQMRYARANLSWNLATGPKPAAQFDWTSVYTKPLDASAGSLTYRDLLPPDPDNNAQFSFGAVDFTDIAFENLTIDMGNTIGNRPDLKTEGQNLGIEQTDRRTVGTWDPEVVNIADFDPYILRDNQTKTELFYGWGQDIGNRHVLWIPGTVISGISTTNRNGLAAYNFDLTAEPVNGLGNSEFFYMVY